jgi:hypothetical protein
MRQQGQSELDVKFSTVLTHLRQGSVQQDDWQFLQTRVFSQLPAQERASFSQAVNLYATKKDVREKNLTMLESSNNPVARIQAQYHGCSVAQGKAIDSDLCYGLQHEILLSVGCRVYFYDS